MSLRYLVSSCSWLMVLMFFAKATIADHEKRSQNVVSETIIGGESVSFTVASVGSGAVDATPIQLRSVLNAAQTNEVVEPVESDAAEPEVLVQSQQSQGTIGRTVLGLAGLLGRVIGIESQLETSRMGQSVDIGSPPELDSAINTFSKNRPEVGSELSNTNDGIPKENNPLSDGSGLVADDTAFLKVVEALDKEQRVNEVLPELSEEAKRQDEENASQEVDSSQQTTDTLVSLDEIREQVLDIVLNHPDVVSQQNSLILAGWRIKETESRSSPRLSFTTTGKYPIADNVAESQLRADNLNRKYIDGNLQLSKPVFDGGKRQFLEQSAVQRSLVEKLKYLETFEQQLSRFLSLLIELKRDDAELQSATADLAFLDSSIDSVRRRYELGVGTLNDVRVLELQRLDLERILSVSQREVGLKRDILLSEFGFSQDNYDWVLDLTASIQDESNLLDLALVDSFTNRMAQLEQVALEMDSQSVKAERFPEVNVTVTGVLYDLSNNPLNEYELYGGLSMNLPLFDGGERDAKIEGIEVQKTIKRSTLKKALSDLQANWDQTEVELKKLESQSLENQARLESIIDRLEELKIRARTIESGLIEVTQTELQRRSVARELVLTQLTRAVLQTRKAELSGRLMEMIRVEPTIQ